MILQKSSKLVILAMIMSATLGGQLAADDYNKYRIQCSTAQDKTITDAIEEAKRLVNLAVSSLPPVNSTTGAKFRRWFGGPAGDSDPQVVRIYEGIRVSFKFSRYWCPNFSTPNSDPGTLAWVPGDAVSEIFFEDAFFQLSTSGADSQAGTIVHEAGHLSFVADVVDSDVTGDNKPDYGVANAEQLARTRPELARRTADNLQYFVEDIGYGIP